MKNTEKNSGNVKKKFDPWAKMDEITKYRQMPTGPEWITIKQFSEHYGLHIISAQRKLMGLVKQGKVKYWSGVSPETKKRASLYAPI